MPVRKTHHETPKFCDQCNELQTPGSDVLLECHVDHFFRNKERMFEVCVGLGDGIILFSGLVICDDKGAMRIPEKDTGR